MHGKISWQVYTLSATICGEGLSYPLIDLRHHRQRDTGGKHVSIRELRRKLLLIARAHDATRYLQYLHSSDRDSRAFLRAKTIANIFAGGRG